MKTMTTEPNLYLPDKPVAPSEFISNELCKHPMDLILGYDNAFRRFSDDCGSVSTAAESAEAADSSAEEGQCSSIYSNYSVGQLVEDNVTHLRLPPKNDMHMSEGPFASEETIKQFDQIVEHLIRLMSEPLDDLTVLNLMQISIDKINLAPYDSFYLVWRTITGLPNGIVDSVQSYANLISLVLDDIGITSDGPLILLACIEDMISQANVVSREVPEILKALFDAQLLDDEAILSWFDGSITLPTFSEGFNRPRDPKLIAIAKLSCTAFIDELCYSTYHLERSEEAKGSYDIITSLTDDLDYIVVLKSDHRGMLDDIQSDAGWAFIH